MPIILQENMSYAFEGSKVILRGEEISKLMESHVAKLALPSYYYLVSVGRTYEGRAMTSSFLIRSNTRLASIALKDLKNTLYHFCEEVVEEFEEGSDDEINNFKIDLVKIIKSDPMVRLLYEYDGDEVSITFATVKTLSGNFPAYARGSDALGLAFKYEVVYSID